MDKFNTLQNVIDEMAVSTSTWSRDNKKKAFRISLAIACLTALVTILVGLQGDFPYFKENQELVHFYFKLSILMMSGLSTVLAVWDNFYNHKQLWINYGETRNHLRALSLEMSLVPEEKRQEVQVLEKYLTKYNQILTESNNNWKKLRLEDADIATPK
jgi:hypothetical protein